MGSPSRRFLLGIVNPEEDQPRIIRAGGRMPDGCEFGLVLRPHEGTGVLVRIARDGTAHAWHTTTGSAPQRPAGRRLDAATAVAAIRDAQKGLGSRPGPITLRGRWTGAITCGEGAPVLTLRRKIVAYGVLTIESRPAGDWSWRFERAERWFSGSGTDSGTAPSLSAAIEAGALGAMRLVRSACGMRDTRRRAASDPAFASKHPVRTRATGADPAERLEASPRVRKAKKAAAKAAAKPKPRAAPRPKAAKPRTAPASSASKPAAKPKPKRTASKPATRAPVKPVRSTTPAVSADDKLLAAFTAALDHALRAA